MKEPQKRRRVIAFAVAFALLLTMGSVGFLNPLPRTIAVSSADTVIEEVIDTGPVEIVSQPEEMPIEPTLDRTKPIYQVYKNGYYVEVPAEWQWYIRDMASQYGFDEKIIFGMILAESTFNANCKGDNERSLGLAQIQRFWITGANIKHFTDDYRSRNLLNPYDNILTLMEIWSYARDAYGLDINSELGMKRLLYWHNTGKDPRRVSNWPYSNKCFGFANELVTIEY